MALAAVVIVVVALLGLVAWLQRGPRAPATGPAEAWSSDASAAYGGSAIAQDEHDLGQGASDWMAGTVSPADFSARLDTELAAFTRVRTAVGNLRPFPYDRRVVGLYRDNADLYVQAVQVYRAAADTQGDERTQLDLLGRRLRELGDRVFDRGQALVTPYLHQPANPAVQVEQPEEVPNWVAEGLAAGPPLDATPPPANGQPQLRQPTRPQQSRAGWLHAVTETHAPSVADVRAAIASQDADQLKALAERLVGAAEVLRHTPDPRGDREESARLRLGYLVDADAARAAQAGAIYGKPLQAALDSVAAAALADAAGLGVSA